MKKVSIIIPVYNVEKYIERCILSIIRQTCLDVFIECILVDDGSQDNSIFIAKKVIEKNSERGIEFRIVKHEKNLGLSVARNTGMSFAQGDYLLFVDSDDYIFDNCIEKFMEVVEKYPNVEIVKGNHVREGGGQYAFSIFPTPQDGNTSMYLLCMTIIPTSAWNTLIKRSYIKKEGLSFRSGLLLEDILWSVDLFRHAKNVVFIPDKTYFYTPNVNSILGTMQVGCQLKFLPHLIVIVDDLLRNFEYRCFVPYTLFVMCRLMQMVDMISKEEQIDDDIYKKVLQLRSRLMDHTMQHWRIILASFELLLYQPFQSLTHFRWFRQNFDWLVKTTCKVAMTFDFLHH